MVASGVPAGLGEPIFDRLDAEIAHALMSINAVKGVEVGDGFAVVEQKGTEHRDEMTPQGFASNHAGGVFGWDLQRPGYRCQYRPSNPPASLRIARPDW